MSFAVLDNAKFTGTALGSVVKFEDSRFDAITDFSGAIFALGGESTAMFLRTRFENSVDFTRSRFHCQVVFQEVTFADSAEFIDTLFDAVNSSARYVGGAVEFNQIEVTARSVLRFESTDPQQKLFHHSVQMSFKETPAGLIRFENANFRNLSAASQDRLKALARLGFVEIGSGCIKYRFQTPITKIDLGEGNTPLIIKLCETFTSYFTVSNGLNLGFEIVERTPTAVHYFFFTDEDISEATFEERLAQTAQQMWSLLSVRSEEQLLALEAPSALVPPAEKENATIHAVDCVTALMGLLFGVGIRIACGKWKEADTRALRRTVLFKEEGPEIAQGLHRVLVDRYTGASLFHISGQQNAGLPSKLIEPPAPRATPRLLFVAVDTNRRDRLRLDFEVKAVEEALRSAGHEDLVALEHCWAATLLDLQHALLRYRPALLHFSGHGTPSGELVMERDSQVPAESRRPETHDSRPAETLARMLGAIEGSQVRCVVLNACFSEVQAAGVAQHADCVIGLSAEVRDSAAIEFARGFYSALAFGQSVQAAFDLGVADVKSQNDAGLYRLISTKADPRTVKLVEVGERKPG
ncbi:MAG: CHAT domain-containing protein [Acidobacteriota bacterium]